MNKQQLRNEIGAEVARAFNSIVAPVSRSEIIDNIIEKVAEHVEWVIGRDADTYDMTGRAEAGYVQLTKHDELLVLEKWQETKLMTGQEFYDRFLNELPTLVSITYSDAQQAAQRAGGLEEKS